MGREVEKYPLVLPILRLSQGDVIDFIYKEGAWFLNYISRSCCLSQQTMHIYPHLSKLWLYS